jgi:hypothetical protein
MRKDRRFRRNRRRLKLASVRFVSFKREFMAAPLLDCRGFRDPDFPQ